VHSSCDQFLLVRYYVVGVWRVFLFREQRLCSVVPAKLSPETDIDNSFVLAVWQASSSLSYLGCALRKVATNIYFVPLSSSVRDLFGEWLGSIKCEKKFWLVSLQILVSYFRNLTLYILCILTKYTNKPTRYTFRMHLFYNFCPNLHVSNNCFVHHQEFMIYCIFSSVQTMQTCLTAPLETWILYSYQI
jgi:hypothetical protein